MVSSTTSSHDEGMTIGHQYCHTIIIFSYYNFIFVVGVSLILNGTEIANNSYVDVDDIGANENALLCHTDKHDCCREHPNRAGEWYFPNGTVVGTGGASQDEFYRDRATQVVRLNRRQGTSTERGLFLCQVPDSNHILQIVYINIGMYIAVTAGLYVP